MKGYRFEWTKSQKNHKLNAMTIHQPLWALLFVVATTVGQGFEPYNYNGVPFPESARSSESSFTSLVESLTDIASISDIPDENRARILAAARRLSPLNRRAFITEYQFKHGQKPTETAPIKKEMVKAFLSPQLLNLQEIPGTGDYIEFLIEALAPVFDTGFDTSTSKSIPNTGPGRFATDSDQAIKGTSAGNSCGLLTMKGCTNLKISSEVISGTNFEFSPGNLKSDYFLSAYRESLKFLAMKNSEGLVGRRIIFQADQTTEKEEGPAAALACAVLTGAVAKHLQIDKKVAFCGDVHADGSIKPTNDLKKRLLASPDRLHHTIVIPAKDSYSADDILLLEGPGLFFKTQLFKVDTLNEALDIAQIAKSQNLASAIQAFTEIQNVLNQPDGAKFITNSHVVKRLNFVLELAPHHLSAIQLKRASQNQYPAYLSLNESFDLIFTALKPALEEDEIDSGAHLDPDTFKKLQRFRTRLDPGLKELTDATFSFETSGRVGSETSAERNRVKQRLKEALNEISRNVAIRERMM